MTGSGFLQKDVWPLELKTIVQRNRVKLRRWGMQVTVTNDGTPANNTTWVLVKGLSSNNRQDNNNWKKLSDYVGGGGGSSTTPKTATFAGDGATTDFVVGESGTIVIANVYQGGQLLIEGTHYTKDNASKTVSFASAPPSSQHIDITYFTDVSVTDGPWQGVWNYAAHSDADPDWAAGTYGYTDDGRGNPGDPDYVPPEALITILSRSPLLIRYT